MALLAPAPVTSTSLHTPGSLTVLLLRQSPVPTQAALPRVPEACRCHRSTYFEVFMSDCLWL